MQEVFDAEINLLIQCIQQKTIADSVRSNNKNQNKLKEFDFN